MVAGTRMLQRRATEADWTTSDYILATGEIGVTTDTEIMKIGNGTSPWSELDIAFDSYYLPILGTAANSELLEGISASFFAKYADFSTAATADSFVQRLSNGRIKGATATDADDLTTLAQQGTAISAGVAGGVVTAKQQSVIRTVTGATTLATTDVGGVVIVNNSSITAQVIVTVPTNTSAAIPVGSFIDICASNNGGAKIIPFDGTVTLSGSVYVFPNYALVRALKTGTNTWMLMPHGTPNKLQTPKIRATKTSVSTYNTGAYTNTPYDGIDSTNTYNPDSEWFSFSGAGLTTGRRIIVNQTAEYEITCNYAGTWAGATITRISKFTADNVSGDVLAMTAATQFFNLKWRGNLAAGESVGVNHGVFGGTNDTDQINSASTPNDFKIFLVGK